MRATFRVGFQEAKQSMYLGALLTAGSEDCAVIYDNEMKGRYLYPLIDRSIRAWLADEKQKGLANVLQLPERDYRQTFTEYTAFLDKAITSLLKGLEDRDPEAKEAIYEETTQNMVDHCLSWHEGDEEGVAASMRKALRWVCVSFHPGS